MPFLQPMASACRGAGAARGGAAAQHQTVPITFTLSSLVVTGIGAQSSFLLYIPWPVGVTQPAEREGNCCSREKSFHLGWDKINGPRQQ